MTTNKQVNMKMTKRDIIKAHEQLDADYKAAQERVEGLQIQVDTTQADSDIEALQDRVEELQADNDRQAQVIADQLSKLEAHQAELKKLREQCDESNAHQAQLCAERDTLLKEKIELCGIEDQLRDELETTCEQGVEDAQQIEALTQERDEAKAYADRLQAQCTQHIQDKAWLRAGRDEARSAFGLVLCLGGIGWLGVVVLSVLRWFG